MYTITIKVVGLKVRNHKQYGVIYDLMLDDGNTYYTGYFDINDAIKKLNKDLTFLK